MHKTRELRDDLPEDFFIPVPLDTNNLTALSPFLVPQTHLGSPAIFMGMSAFMFLLVVLGVPINVLTVFCTAKYRKLRSHLNYILVNLAVANLLVISVGSTTAFYSFSHMYFALGPMACKIEGFTATLGGEWGCGRERGAPAGLGGWAGLAGGWGSKAGGRGRMESLLPRWSQPLHLRHGESLVSGRRGLRAIPSDLQTPGELHVPWHPRHHRLPPHLGLRPHGLCTPPLRMEPVHPRGAPVLVRPRLVHDQQQVEQRILRDLPLLLLLRGPPQRHHLLLRPPAADTARRGQATGAVSHDAEGRAGGDQDGGGDGGRVPGVLAALRLLRAVGRDTPWGALRRAPGLRALRLLQSLHRLQPRHLCLHEQAGWRRAGLGHGEHAEGQWGSVMGGRGAWDQGSNAGWESGTCEEVSWQKREGWS
uniref:G-protein coupled receptors family 1 profile domain-containing protein n=1 Tax=Gopherus agassizii TaxID=38772 RepID=A0A452GLS0_9SAUR